MTAVMGRHPGPPLDSAHGPACPGNREIAAALALSEGTEKNHVSSIFSKLSVTDRTKAVLRAIALGLV